MKFEKRRANETLSKVLVEEEDRKFDHNTKIYVEKLSVSLFGF
jgi:hypothetical protein